MTRNLIICLALVALAGSAIAEDKKSAWVAPMRKVHSKFTGKKGTLGLFGDSITHSLAFWAGLPYAHRNMPAALEADFKLVSQRQVKDCWQKWRGPAFGNEGGMTIRWADANVGDWLKKLNPEAVVLMFGTNDLHSVPIEEYEKKLRHVVRRCLDNGTVVILTTIPPRAGMLEKSRRFAEAGRRVAKDLNVPLCDYFGECLKRRPHDWDGSAAAFKGFATYEVPTLISRDGVHPSNPAKFAGDYSAAALRTSGFGLRNALTLASYAEVIRKVFEKGK